MDTTERLVFAFLGAMAAFVIFVRVCWRRQGGSSPLFGDKAHLEEVLRQVAPGIPGASIVDGGLRLVHRGLHGRLDFISDKTEIQIRTGNLVQQVVEVVPIGFPMSLFSGGGKDRLRARGSRTEYDRIFRRPADEHVLLEVGVAYDLRMSPDGVILRIHALPGTSAALSHWIACTCRIIDLIPADLL